MADGHVTNQPRCLRVISLSPRLFDEHGKWQLAQLARGSYDEMVLAAE